MAEVQKVVKSWEINTISRILIVKGSDNGSMHLPASVASYLFKKHILIERRLKSTWKTFDVIPFWCAQDG